MLLSITSSANVISISGEGRGSESGFGDHLGALFSKGGEYIDKKHVLPDLPVSQIQIVLNSETTLPKMLFGTEVCSVQLMCETLQPVWQQMVERLWSQTKQTSQMNTFKQAFLLLMLDYLTLRNVESEQRLCRCHLPQRQRPSLSPPASLRLLLSGPSVVQLWPDSSSCGPAALTGFGHFENVPGRLPEVRGTQQQIQQMENMVLELLQSHSGHLCR